METSVAVVAALGAALVAAIYISHQSGGDDVPDPPPESKEKRNITWVFDDYKNNLSNPLFLQNRFADRAYVERVAPGTAQVPQLDVSHGGNRYWLYRIPERV